MKLRKVAFVILWIVLWGVAALALGSPLILASPAETAMAFVSAVTTSAFWLSIALTFAHVAIGAILGCAFGCLFGVLGWRFPVFKDFIEPMVQFIKSAPLVCFVVLLLVWFGSAYVDLIAVCLAILPGFYFSIIQALGTRDVKLFQMLEVFHVSRGKRWAVFEWPTIRPYFVQASRTAAGMAWKSGVTAELVGLTFASIGRQVYAAKLVLDTAGLLMWTIVVVILGWACEKLVVALVNALSRRLDAVADNAAKGESGVGVARACVPAVVDAKGLVVRYGDTTAIDGFDLHVGAGERYVFNRPTGWGKTSFFRVLLGLQKADGGVVTAVLEPAGAAGAAGATSAGAQGAPAQGAPVQGSAVFQEERLLPQLTAAQNIALAAGCDLQGARELLMELLPADAADLLPVELSGGMKRCVEICRAFAAQSNFVVMDEPFNGLDAQKRTEVEAFIERHRAGRTLIISSHIA